MSVVTVRYTTDPYAASRAPRSTYSQAGGPFDALRQHYNTAGSTVSRKSSQYSSSPRKSKHASPVKTGYVADMPGSDYFNSGRSKEWKQQQRLLDSPGYAGSAVSGDYSGRRHYDRRDSGSQYDELDDVTPEDSVSNASFSGRSHNSSSSRHSRHPSSSRRSSVVSGYSTVIRKPAHLDPYPEEHEDQWRVDTGFTEHERPYYDEHNDYDDNYVVNPVPFEKLNRS